MCVTTDLTVIFFFYTILPFLQLSWEHYYLHHWNMWGKMFTPWGVNAVKWPHLLWGVIWSCRAIIRPHGFLKSCSHITDSPSWGTVSVCRLKRSFDILKMYYLFKKHGRLAASFKTSVVQKCWICVHHSTIRTSYPIMSLIQVVFTYGSLINICLERLRQSEVLPKVLLFCLGNLCYSVMIPLMFSCPWVHFGTKHLANTLFLLWHMFHLFGLFLLPDQTVSSFCGQCTSKLGILWNSCFLMLL